jgi:small subunit ribosomal protein S2
MKEISLLEMLKAGAHFGHKSSLWNPKMAPFIFTTRTGIHIIDLEKTKTKLIDALTYLNNLVAKGGVVLFVGTKKHTRTVIKNAAESCGMPYVVTRWLGGTFTNFKTIQRTIKKMERMQKMVADGEITRYTKKEQLMIARELEKMRNIFEGIKDMRKLPDAIFVLDVKVDEIPVKEAKHAGVKIVGIVDTNCDPSLIDYPIPSNDDAIKVVDYMANIVAESINEGKKRFSTTDSKPAVVAE